MNSSIYINPKNCLSDIGNHILEIKLEDELPASTIYRIIIEVKNMPPVYTSTKLPKN